MTCFVVCGMPRTGTSLTMGILQKMGVHTGPTRTGANNPDYYESQLLLDYINQKSGVKAEDVIKSISEGHEDCWGLKHPSVIAYWNELGALIDDPRFIVCHRRDKEAQYMSHFNSIRRQDRESFDKRDRDYYANADRISSHHTAIHVTYEDWFDEVARNRQLLILSKFCGLEITDEAIQLIDPDLKHY